MSAASAHSWPGSRVLLGWWRELAGRQPQQLGVGRLLFHHVEALVRVSRRRTLDRWQQALLRLCSTRIPCGDLIGALTDLQIEPQLLGRFVRELTASGFLHLNGSGLWQITPVGRQALATGTLSLTAEERRTFAFVDNSSLGRQPHFLPLSGGRQPPESSTSQGADAPRSEGCSFEVACLEACLRQAPEWKARYRFPTDVEARLTPRAREPVETNWRRVIVDAVQSRLLVFVRTASATGKPLLLGFTVPPQGGTLEPEPLLALTEGWQEALPDLNAEPSLELWRQAWQEWSRPRSLPPVEVAACRLERADYRLIVHAPPRLIDRLRAARSDAIKQEAWLLAGEGRTRLAAQLVLEPL
jgi:hypothetical protein